MPWNLLALPASSLAVAARQRLEKSAFLFLFLFTLATLVLLASVPSFAQPQGWRQVNQDGFVSGLGPSADGTLLFAFAGNLYASNDQGIFRMEDPFAKSWTQLSIPGASGPGATPSSWLPLGDYLYASDSGQIWWIGTGPDLEGPNWNQVTSVGLPGGVSPTPRILFAGQVYAYYEFFDGLVKKFEIWRSPDIGQAVMNWERVVTSSFGDPDNNRAVDIMAVFGSRLLAGTGTLEFVFGAPDGKFDGGVEVWESPSGNSGTWSQVNVDGFGTSIPFVGVPGNPPQDLFTNHVLGSQAEYMGHLFVGTKSHWGAEVWRYDGTGSSGWVDVTPPWAGPDPFFPSDSKRFESMVTFQGSLYAAEGFPSANLSRYDGQDWSTVVAGPNPFDPDNIMLISLAVFEDGLYVTTSVGGSATRGDQVWAFGLNQAPVADAGPDQIAACRSPDGAEVTLDGTGSFDPDGDPLTYTWTNSFGTTSGPTPTVTLSDLVNLTGMDTITLEVDDGQAIDTDTVEITVDCECPCFDLTALSQPPQFGSCQALGWGGGYARYLGWPFFLAETWMNGCWFTSPFAANVIVSPIAPIDYQVCRQTLLTAAANAGVGCLVR